MPALACGNPQEAPASSTRFVLPFAYRRELVHPEPSDRYYQRADLADIQERAKYFTTDTALPLFCRSLWLELNKMDERPFDVHFPDGATLKVEALPPRLVLFEWESCQDQANADDPMAMGS